MVSSGFTSNIFYKIGLQSVNDQRKTITLLESSYIDKTITIVYIFLFFFFLIVSFFIYFFNNNSEPVVPTSSGGTNGNKDDPKDPKNKKSFLRKFLIFFFLGSFFCISFFFVFYLIYCRFSIVYYDMYGDIIPSNLVVFDQLPGIGEYAPFSYWEDYFRAYLDPIMADYIIQLHSAERDFLVFSGEDIADIIRLLGGGGGRL